MPEICSICEGSGHRIIIGPGGNQFAEPCSCRIQVRVERLLDRARIPVRYAQCSLGDFDYEPQDESMSNAFLAAHKFAVLYPADTCGNGILFTGPPGVGKTHLAIGILKHVIEHRGATGIFWEHKELLETLRSFYDGAVPGSENKLLGSVIRCDVLVLDDLGDITPSDWTWDTTSYILNSRYNENRTTIVTTNHPNEISYQARSGEETSRRAEVRRAMRRVTLGDQIGERMRSRLQEMCVVVPMQGEDFRQRSKRARFG